HRRRRVFLRPLPAYRSALRCTSGLFDRGDPAHGPRQPGQCRGPALGRAANHDAGTGRCGLHRHRIAEAGHRADHRAGREPERGQPDAADAVRQHEQGPDPLQHPDLRRESDAHVEEILQRVGASLVAAADGGFAAGGHPGLLTGGQGGGVVTEDTTMKLMWFHLMPYTELPENFRGRHPSVWVDIHSSLFDPKRAHLMYNDFMDELEYAAECGFDAVCVNEHHSNGYGLMPSPNLIASALARRTTDTAICVMGNSLALYNPPTRVAEEFAMIDVISGGRLIAGFPVGTPMDTCYAYGTNPSMLRDR